MAVKRNVYLKMKPLEEARRLTADAFPVPEPPTVETIPSPEAVGRILAEPVFARVSSPNFHAAAMDGIAVKAEATFGASDIRPKELAVGSEAFFLNTGHVLPPGTDAVIMIEQVQTVGTDRVRIEAPAFPWQYVRKMGEDIVATELLFPRNHQVTPYCLGALLGGGVFEVAVRRKPRVLILPTGSELIDWRRTPLEDIRAGQVIESNGYVLAELVTACGGEAVKHPILKDDPGAISRMVSSAVEGDFDLVLTVGGSSAGSEDYTRGVVASLGEVLIHGVTMMPGKPVLVGRVGGKPVMGMPGYPVSMIVAFEQLVRPLICRYLGRPEPERVTVPVQPARKIPSKLGVEEFLRVKIGRVGDRYVATSLPRGAGSITSLTEADGIIRIPRESEGIAESETATAELLRPLSAVRGTLVIVGSHDNTLDLMADQLRVDHPDVTLSSSHVGSMGGLMAIRRGVCHMAGCHLLDAEDGSYNLSYVRRFLPDTPVKIVQMVYRDQGLMVLPDNPKKIRGLEDLARKDVRFINRQGGSGTRILLDFRLSQLGIDPATIRGYDTEEFTHMSVAVAVLSGAADVGLGIHAAARALNLAFIPVVTEQYDLVIPAAHFDMPAVQALLTTLRSDAFKRRVTALGGYHTEKTGEMILE